MNYADVLEKWFESGMKDLWRNVRAMPEEKLDWKPAETSRTARELMEEIVNVMQYNIDLISTGVEPKMDWDGGKKNRSVDELEKELKEKAADYIAAVKGFSDDKLDEQLSLEWGKMSFLEVIAYPYWNMMYHIGQIAYIQTLYGDKEMH